MTKRMQNSYPSMQGFTLIEVLIAVLVLSIGLLGLASLQAASLKNNYGAYMRSQASILANDMADRIRSNPGSGVAGTGGALDGDYNAIGPGGLPYSPGLLVVRQVLAQQPKLQLLIPQPGVHY